MHIVNPPKSATFAYPISTYTYVILPETRKRGIVRKFVFWALTRVRSTG